MSIQLGSSEASIPGRKLLRRRCSHNKAHKILLEAIKTELETASPHSQVVQNFQSWTF